MLGVSGSLNDKSAVPNLIYMYYKYFTAYHILYTFFHLGHLCLFFIFTLYHSENALEKNKSVKTCKCLFHPIMLLYIFWKWINKLFYLFII